MEPTEPAAAGTGNEFYNLIAVLYHALHGAETIGMYLADAEASGNTELAAFFRETQDMQRQIAERATTMLPAVEVSGAAPAAGGAAVEPTPGGVTAEPAAPTSAETTGPVAPGATPEPRDIPREDVPPQTPPEETTRPR